MENQTEQFSELKILEAAKQEFYKRGYHGARMREIAESAGINKAMLHYYFRSKDKLFDAIFEDAMQKIFFNIGSILDSDIPFDEKIRKFAEAYIGILRENPFLPAFILHEINHNIEKLEKMFLANFKQKPIQFLSHISAEAAKNGFGEVDSRHFLVNLLSLCLFPFAAKPLLKANLGFNDVEFDRFIEERKKIVPELLLKSLNKL